MNVSLYPLDKIVLSILTIIFCILGCAVNGVTLRSNVPVEPSPTKLSILISLISYFAFTEYKKKQKLKISDKYNSTLIEYSENKKKKTKNSLVDLIYKND